VTLKFRTGPAPDERNAVRVARLAENAGIQMLTLHGRTRACGFKGHAEYATIRAVKNAVGIPVVANGDIDSPAKARYVLARTGADALMIGRAAQGRPWIFREIAHFLATGETLPAPTIAEARTLLLGHLEDHYAFYGEFAGVRTARKHIIWYTRGLAGSAAFRQHMNTLDTTAEQMRAVAQYFDTRQGERLAYSDPASPDAAADDEYTEALAA
jgi:tRNA-dihydrouridine synthase B